MPWYALPWVWWRRHAWIVLWALVILTPAALLSLRLVDDTDLALLIQPLLGVMLLIFLVALGMAVRASLHRSSGARALVGGASAVLAAALLALPMILVIGQRVCPERMGADRGVEVSIRLLEAWRKGQPAASEVWAGDAASEAWKPRTEGQTLVDYRLVDTGCWDRLAPVTTRKTWHEFRVTVRQGDRDSFSRTLVVHTSATRDGWKIAEIDGPDS